MTARVTQQVLVVGYKTSPEARVTSVVMEVARPNTSSAVTAANTQVVVVASS